MATSARSNSSSSSTTRSRVAQICAQLGALRVRELQIVLSDLNLSRTGRKQELVDRITSALQQFEAKAAESVSNHATSQFYTDQLNTGIRSIEGQLQASRPNYLAHSVAPPIPLGSTPRSVSSASSSTSSSAAAGRYPSTGRAVPTIPYAPRTNHHARYDTSTSSASSSSHYSMGNSAGYELLKAAYPAEIDGARCLCGHPNVSGKVVACAQCNLLVHAKCHQLVTAAQDEWYCEACRSECFDPFVRVIKTVLPAQFVKFTRVYNSTTPHSTFRIEYVITDKDLNDLYATRDPKPGAMTPKTRELQLRCFTVKEELGTGTSWPASTNLTVNGFTVPITQRAPPGHSNPSKVLRELPANVFPFSRVGRNVIEVRTGENPLIFAFLIQIVEFRGVQEIVDEVVAASSSITYEEAKKEVIKSFGGDDDDDEDGIETTCTILSVRCPLGLCVIALPARGRHCKHLQCFDLKTFLLFNKKARSRAYMCTVCHQFIKASDLRIDPYLKKLLADVADDEELEEVEISPDATWKRRVLEDAAPTPPQKKMKQETTEVTTASSSSSTTSNGATENGSSAAAPFEIDLSLTSDEEDDSNSSSTAMTTAARPAARAPLPPAQSVNASQSSSTTLTDDDVAILTVDSDIWETNSSGMTTSGGSASNLLPFPLDDALFASFAGNGNPVSLSASASSWNPLYTASLPSTVNPYGPPPPPAAGSSIAWNGASRGASQSDTDLASAMALLSRNHPVANNPFDPRSTQPQVPSVPAGGGRAPSTSRPTSTTTQQDILDVICLLDSDDDE